MLTLATLLILPERATLQTDAQFQAGLPGGMPPE